MKNSRILSTYQKTSSEMLTNYQMWNNCDHKWLFNVGELKVNECIYTYCYCPKCGLTDYVYHINDSRKTSTEEIMIKYWQDEGRYSFCHSIMVPQNPREYRSLHRECSYMKNEANMNNTDIILALIDQSPVFSNYETMQYQINILRDLDSDDKSIILSILEKSTIISDEDKITLRETINSKCKVKTP